MKAKGAAKLETGRKKELTMRAEAMSRDTEEEAPPSAIPEIIIIPVTHAWSWGPRGSGFVVQYKEHGAMPSRHTPFMTMTEAKEWTRRFLLSRYSHRPDDVAAVMAKLHAEYPDSSPAK